MAELLAIAKEEFYVMGINSNPGGYGIAKNYFRNVPATSTGSWKFPWRRRSIQRSSSSKRAARNRGLDRISGKEEL